MTSQITSNCLVLFVLLAILGRTNSHTDSSDSLHRESLALSKPQPLPIKVSASQQNNETNSNECPNFLSVKFFFNKTRHDIRLVRSSGIHGNRIPVYLNNPENVIEYKHNMNVHLCHYIDIYKSATFSVQKADSQYILDGTFRDNGSLYAIWTEGHDIINNKKSKKEIVHYIQHLSSGDLHSPPLKSLRPKRQARKQYNVGVLVVVDSAIFKRWYSASNATSNQAKIDDAIANIRYYFSHLMNEVNMRYQTIQDTDYQINVYLVGFSISQSAQDSTWTEEDKVQGNKVDVYKVINKFRRWVNQRSGQFAAFDHAILFTGNDLTGPTFDGSVSTATTGQSYVGGICKYDKVSIVEDKSRFKSSTTAAHEIGHNLGAGHDGQDNSCSAASQFIMTPLIDSRTPDNYYNIFTFSSCSKNELDRSLRSIPDDLNCLEDRPNVYNEDEWRRFLNIMPGQKYSSDIQCQNIYGEGSYFCATQTYGEKICQKITCHNPAKEDCFIPSDIPAVQGTTCGDKKWCDGGHCVRDDRAPSVNPNCIFGDYRGLLLNKTVTCQEMIRRSPHYCYHKTNRELCCASCAKVFRSDNPPGCEYGDHADWCSALSGRGCSLNAEACCETCSTPKTPDTGCTDDASGICNNMEKHQCYDSRNQVKCCTTCERIKRELRLQDSCPYGDKDPSCKSVSKTSCYYYNFGTLDKCCETCQKMPIKGCEFGDRMPGCVQNSDGCSKESSQCCQTCSHSSTKTAWTPYVILSFFVSSIYHYQMFGHS